MIWTLLYAAWAATIASYWYSDARSLWKWTVKPWWRLRKRRAQWKR